MKYFAHKVLLRIMQPQSSIWQLMKVTKDFDCFFRYRINENKDNSKALLRKNNLLGGGRLAIR